MEKSCTAPNNKNEETAREILGDDIVFPKEVAQWQWFHYPKAVLDHFENTMPSEEVLYWCKKNNYAIVAGPPVPMGLIEVRSSRLYLFFNLNRTRRWDEFREWYDISAFSYNEKVATEWLAIRKHPVPNSGRKHWDQQLRLLSKDERVPNATEMSWFVTTFYEVRGVRLFERKRGRVSSVSEFGDGVSIGHFNESGLSILYDDWGSVHDYPGITACRLPVR